MSTKPPSRVVFVGNIPYGKPSATQIDNHTVLTIPSSQDSQKSRSVNSSAAQAKSLTSALSTIEIPAVQRALVSPNIQTQVCGTVYLIPLRVHEPDAILQYD